MNYSKRIDRKKFVKQVTVATLILGSTWQRSAAMSLPLGVLPNSTPPMRIVNALIFLVKAETTVNSLTRDHINRLEGLPPSEEMLEITGHMVHCGAAKAKDLN
ncbi:hypothetical protein L6164_033581 [Bauhinia variegata]|uniref:Uncharacterized protein n=1 Tax=Bauhinia variegata TaxID=167791 RepID=A0ACB9KSB7_BAUVA|nr:hypothetical protein L6164_033581 [Bauhinia variegata]